VTPPVRILLSLWRGILINSLSLSLAAHMVIASQVTFVLTRKEMHKEFGASRSMRCRSSAPAGIHNATRVDVPPPSATAETIFLFLSLHTHFTRDESKSVLHYGSFTAAAGIAACCKSLLESDGDALWKSVHRLQKAKGLDFMAC
jgi:hypothetical protein